jgi:hypothetical protein
MTKPNAEELALQFHNIISRLAPSFTPDGPGFGKLSEAEHKLVAATFNVLLSSLPDTPQNVEYEASHWQRRCGALLTLIEGFVDGFPPNTMTVFLDSAYRVVNMNPHTKSVDEPYADVATMNMRNALLMACAAELVRPGPMAPQWLLDAVSLSPDPDEGLIAAGVMHQVVDAEQRAVAAERERDTAKKAVRLLRKDYEDLLVEHDAIKSYADGGDETVALGLKAVAECNVLREQLEDAHAVIAELEGRALEQPADDQGQDLDLDDFAKLEWHEEKTMWGLYSRALIESETENLFCIGASSIGQYFVELNGTVVNQRVVPAFGLEEAKLHAWRLYLAYTGSR